MFYLGANAALRSSRCAVPGYEVLRCDGSGVVNGGIGMRKCAQDEAVGIRVYDHAWTDLFRPNHRDGGEEGGGRVGSYEGAVDVEAILEEDEGGVGVACGKRGGDEGREGGRDVWGGFGAEEEVVVRRKVFGGEVRDGGADWGG